MTRTILQSFAAGILAVCLAGCTSDSNQAAADTEAIAEMAFASPADAGTQPAAAHADEVERVVETPAIAKEARAESSVRPGPTSAQDNGCDTGAEALGRAYVSSNCYYKLILGTDLEGFVAAHKAHFAVDGDAIRCARVLARGFSADAIQSHDQDALDRMQHTEMQLQSMGIAPGTYTQTQSQRLHGMSQRMLWLAEVLPPAAKGDFGPMQMTASQQSDAQACWALEFALQFPETRAAMAPYVPMVEDLAKEEHALIVRMAQNRSD